MGGSKREKIRVFLRFWITPAQPMDPNVRLPPRVSVYVLGSIGIIVLEWWYFYAEFPYAGIPNKPLFLLSLVAWMIPPIVVTWAYRGVPSKRELNATSNLFIVIGLLVVVLSILAGPVDALLPVIAAAIPGLMAGGLIGSDAALLWKLRHQRASKRGDIL